MNKAVFFDRDDTIIINVPYNGDPEKVELVPHAAEALELLQLQNFLLIVVSNQSGVGRGYISEQQVEQVNEEMIRQLGKNYFSAILSCYDHPDEENSDCRKPAPGMLKKAAKQFDIDLFTSYIVGDKLSDIQAGISAGCTTILLKTLDNYKDQQHCLALAQYQAKSLLDAAKWILTDC